MGVLNDGLKCALDESRNLDIEFIRAAVESADPSALRLALLQSAPDESLETMTVEKQPVWGGAWMAATLAPQHHAEVREKALDFLVRYLADRPPATEIPSPERLRHLMNIFAGHEVSDVEYRWGREELALDQSHLRHVQWHHKPDEKVLSKFNVLVIGAGPSGIASAIQLKRLGIPFTVAEKNAGVGGTWYRNVYPGARVDIPSHHYQYSFEHDYPWKSYYATQPELQSYLEHCANKFDVTDSVQLRTEVISAVWDESDQAWRVTLRRDGKEEVVTANAIIAATGLFNKASVPDIRGIDTFKGAAFHTSSWDYSFNYAGKRVGIIGNGSSGAQLMPEVAKDAAHVTVFQRSAGWISPVVGYREDIPPQHQWLFRTMPFYLNWYRFGIFITLIYEIDSLQIVDKDFQRKGGMVNERIERLKTWMTDYIVSKVGHNPELLAKCMPKVAPWAKRPVVDNGFYDALNLPHVHLVTDKIERVTPNGVLTADGTEHPLDLLVVGVGFDASRYLWPIHFEGRDGVSREQAWRKDGARAYLGMTMPHFPNLFIMYGPNGQARGGGIFAWTEIWARYAVECIEAVIERKSHSLEVKQDVFDDYNKRMDAVLEKLIWKTSDSYFHNEFGRQVVNMPWAPDVFYDMITSPKDDDYTWK